MEVNRSDEYENSKSIVLILESLNTEYKNYILQYKQTVLDYVNLLKQQTSSTANSTQSKFVYVRGKTYLGTSSVGQNSSTTMQLCEASCASTPGCTGATFNNSNTITCKLRGGDSDLSSGSTNDFALITKEKQLLSIIEDINGKLQDVNQKIQNINDNRAEPEYKSQTTEREENTDDLIKQFEMLTYERNKIKEMLNEYETLDEKQESGNLEINKNYYSFLLLLGLAIIFVIVLIKSSTSYTPVQPNVPMFQIGGGELKPSTYYFIALIFIIIIIGRFKRGKKRYDDMFND